MDSERQRGALLGVGARLWQLAVSPVTFVVLSLLWCLDLALGSIAAYRRDPQFWVKMDAYPFNAWLREVAPQAFPDSLWVYVLVILTYLVVASLVLCTVNWLVFRRRRLRGMGEFLVHLGFLLVFVGFVLGSGFGARIQGVRVVAGQTVPIAELGVSLRVDEVEALSGEMGQRLDTVSRVTVLEEGAEVAAGTVRTNHPLIHGSTVVYPQDAGSRITTVWLSLDDGTQVAVQPERRSALPNGGFLYVRGLLESGQRGGPYVGPGMLLARLDERGRFLAQDYLPLRPGQPLAVDLAGLRVSLVDLEDAAYAVYNVHRDPGVRWVLAGAVILGLGTLWALVTYLAGGPGRQSTGGAPVAG